MFKVVLITGATSGIGNATARYLSERGFKVYGTGRNTKLVTEQTFELLSMDLNDFSSIKPVVEKIIKREGRIDVLINNAGVGMTGPAEECSYEDTQKLFNTNFFGAVELIKTVLPHMRTNRSGLIINITSIAGYMGLPFRAMYCSSKAALEVFTEALRMELKSFGIKITNIAPGDFATSISKHRFHENPEASSYPHYRKVLELINSHVSKGKSPDLMAKKIYRVIEKSNPKVQYKSGSFLQKFSIVLKRILPSNLFERMLMNHYKI